MSLPANGSRVRGRTLMGSKTRRLASAPYVVEANAPFEIVIVTCPFALLTRQADRVRRQTAQRMDCSAGVGHLVRQYLAGLRALLEADACSEDACSHLAEGMLDLIRALYNSGRSPQPSASRSSQRLRAQIDRYIEDNLARPGLDRAMIARENFISRSYLDRLYHGDAGVSEAIREKRLDQVRRELADADLAALSVFAIALRWGFVSPSHFSRTFRAAYGQSPTAYRAALARRD